MNVLVDHFIAWRIHSINHVFCYASTFALVYFVSSYKKVDNLDFDVEIATIRRDCTRRAQQLLRRHRLFDCWPSIDMSGHNY